MPDSTADTSGARDLDVTGEPAARNIDFRPETAEDEAFLREVYASTRADEMALVDWNDAQKSTFLDMQFNAQHTYYREQFPDATYDVVRHAGVPVGRLYVDRTPDEIHVIDIALLPAFRNRGIGAYIIKQIMNEAAANSQSVRLYVEIFNRARRFYNRLAFREVQTEGIYLQLEWRSDYGPA